MNKIPNPKSIGDVFTLRSNLRTIMRVFLTLIAMGLSAAYANPTYSQTKIDIDVKDVNLEELFQEIQGKSEFIFFYKDDVLDKDKRVTLHMKKTTLAKILKRAFADTNLSYSIDNRQVVIKKIYKEVIQSTNSEGIQQLTVSGSVTGPDGYPLPGANLLIKGTTNGTQTDFDGNYTLNIDSPDAILLISYIGFKSQEIAVAGQSTINIQLVEDAARLDEIIVTGYGTQTRGEITGAVVSVEMADAIKLPVQNAAELLQGRATGVNVTNSGTPGEAPKISIRGFGTSNNTDPLYIIDGVQTDNNNVLNNINPADIKQLTVLKDAAAAIYGARASNGVIIITTNGGSYNMDKPTVSFDIYSGFSKLSHKVDMLNVDEHAAVTWESLVNQQAINGLTNPPSHAQYGGADGNSGPVVPTTVQGAAIDGVPFTTTVKPNGGTDWIDAITQTAPTSNVSFSVANGTDTGKYYLSASYLNREGIVKYTGFKRGNTRLNSEFRVGDNKKLTVGQHLNIAFSKATKGTDDATELALRITPLIPVRNDAGEFAGTEGLELGNSGNPVANNFRARHDYEKNYSFIGDIYGDYKITDKLNFKTVAAGGFNILNLREFVALNPEAKESRSAARLTEGDLTSFNWSWTNTLNYRNTFGKHSVNALAGIEAIKERGKGKTIQRSSFLNEDPNFVLLSNGIASPNVSEAIDGSTTLFSIFGTVNYAFDSKYFLTLTVRNDKSSRFIGDNQSQTFPSVSAGWELSKEDFFNTEGFVNRLKIRASYGELGNQTLPIRNPAQNGFFQSQQYADYSFDGGSIVDGVLLTQVGNPDLKWETSKSVNIGLDFTLLDRKLSGFVEYFNIETNDLIVRDNNAVSLTAIDAGAPFVNFGTVVNKGVDFQLSWNDQIGNDFSYSISGNISTVKNEVTEFKAPLQGNSSGIRKGQVTRTEEGDEISFFYGREITGLTPEGRFIYRDVNGDGEINTADRTKIGSPHPDFTYGANFNANYKNFDISFFFQGTQGNDLWNYNKVFTDFGFFFNGNRSTRTLDARSPSNPNGSFIALSATSQNNEDEPNSYYVEDGSYLRLKNATIGYTLPSSALGRIGISSLRLYLTGSNLFTITDYEGFDPEVIPIDNLTLGLDRRINPLSRTIIFGVNVKF
ncbi:MAG: TonB-dependent receptor [Flavobacteriaceae bacterium]